MSIPTPVVNARQYYINGLNLVYVNGTTLTVTAGRCGNSTNANDISVGLPLNVAATQTGVLPVDAGTGNVLIDTSVNGAAGLDTGSLAGNTFYAVYAIGDSYGNNPGSALMSANLTTPLLPSGYDMYFRLGYVKVNNSVVIIGFRQDGCGLDRWMWYDSPIATDVTAGSSATYAFVDCSASLPTSVATMLSLYCSFTPTGTNDDLILAPGTSNSITGYAILSGTGAGVDGNLICPCNSPNTTAIKYKVTGSAAVISVGAYLDQLVINPSA